MDQKKLLKEYQNQVNEILNKMYKVVVRATRKKDDANYKKVLEKLKQ